jgi:hypothetical protein
VTDLNTREPLIKWNRMRSVLALGAIGSIFVVLLAPLVAANPVPMFDVRFDSWWYALLAIGLVNFGVNLLFVSSLLHLSVKVKGRTVGAFSTIRWKFLAQVLGANLIITASGAMIDFLAFYRQSNGFYEFQSSSEGLILGSVLVSISAAIVCLFVLRLEMRISLAIAVTLGIVNSLAWASTFYIASETPFLLIVVAIFSILSAPPMYLLIRWHSRVLVKSSLEDDGASFDDRGVLRCNLLCLFGIGLAYTGWLMDEVLYDLLGTAGEGWMLILFAAALGFVSPLAGGGFMLFLVIVSDTAAIGGFGFEVSVLTTLIMLSSFVYPLGIGYERRRGVLDRVLTFRTTPALGPVGDEAKSPAGGSID